MNKQVKISFDTNCWDKEHFRRFIKSLQDDDEANFDYWIVTEETDTDYVNKVAIEANITVSSKIVYITPNTTTTVSDKLAALITYNIKFHFDSVGTNVNYINNNNLDLQAGKPLSFLVNWISNTYTLEMKYIEKFKVQLSRYLDA